MGHLLSRQMRRFLIVERAESVGTAWRERWDSLRLFTSRRYDAFPGSTFPGDPDGYPDRDEVIAYLEQYAKSQALPIAFDSTVRSLRASDAGGGFALELGNRQITADQVVVATGPFQVARIPEIEIGR